MKSSIVTAAKIFSLGLLILAFYFILQAVSENWNTIAARPQELSLRYVFCGFVALQIYWCYQISLWRWVMKGYGDPINFGDAGTLYFSNILLAYIPGKIASVTGVAILAERKGVSAQRAVTAALLFQIYSIVSGTLFLSLLSQGVAIAGDVENAIDHFWLLGVFSLVGLIMLSPPLQRNTLSTLSRVFKRDLEIQIPRYSILLSQAAAYAVGWSLVSSSIWLFFLAIAPRPEDVSFFLVATVFVVSYLMGLVSFFVPAGIGILEAGLLVGLGSALEPGTILWGAAMFRLAIITSSSVSLFLLSKLGNKPHRGYNNIQ